MSLTVITAVGGFLTLLAAALVVAWLAFLLGRWLGVREARREHPEHQGPVGSIVGATLALLAFTLAITFNMAHGKHHDRKELVREDAKAIRMAYDRALLLPPEAAKVAQEKLAEYARIRAFDTFAHPDTQLPLIFARSEEIQHELWAQALEHRAHPQARFYMDSLSMLTLGYQSSLAGSRRTWAIIPLLVAFCVVLCMAVDLDRPQQGILRVDQGPMIRLAEALSSLPGGL